MDPETLLAQDLHIIALLLERHKNLVEIMVVDPISGDWSTHKITEVLDYSSDIAPHVLLKVT